MAEPSRGRARPSLAPAFRGRPRAVHISGDPLDGRRRSSGTARRSFEASIRGRHRDEASPRSEHRSPFAAIHSRPPRSSDDGGAARASVHPDAPPHLARKYPGGAGAGPRSRLLRPPDAARGASGSGWGSGGHPPASAGVAPARLRSRRGHRRRLGRARCRPGASVLPSPPHPDPRCPSVAIRRTPSCGATTDTFRKIPHPSRSAAPWRASCRARRARRGGRFSAGAPTGSGGWDRLTPFGDPARPRGTVPRPPIAREPPLSPPGAPRRSS